MMSEIQQKLMHASADECMSPDQRDLFDQIGANDPDVYARLLRCAVKRVNPELLEALQVLTLKRHMFYPTEFGGYVCRHCDGLPHEVQHFRVGEDAKTDIEKAKAAINKATGD